MKRIIYILTFGLLLSLSSCIRENITEGYNPHPSSNSGIQIIGASEEFDVHNVTTRAEEGVSDSFISEMTMLIFDNNDDMLTAYDANQNVLKSSHINIRRSNPTFLIETSKYDGTGILASMEAGMTAKYYKNKEGEIDACKIYIIANAYHLIREKLESGEIKNLSDLEEFLLDTKHLGMPINEDTREYIGLPMIGFARDEKTGSPATFDLSYHQGESNNNAVATIPLKKLYSKVSFSIQVNSKQLVTGQVPEFKLDDVEVYNVPSQTRMEYDGIDYNGEYLFTGEEGNDSFSFLGNGMLPSDLVCRHSSSVDTDDVIEFHFYMPEHKVTPEYTETSYPDYPANLPPENRQYFKPKLIGEGKIATFVRIYGVYTDHNGNIHDIAYDIYLGKNNTDDFTITRNQHLHNRLIINGITNHKDAYGGDEKTISIDHRVSITHKGYHLSIERETIIDSHFEVRPLDIELEPEATMTIVIPDDYKEWIGMEQTPGVRNYFTTNLISELQSTITITNNDPTLKKTYRVWFYIDENLNAYDATLPKDTIKEEDGYIVSDQLYRLGKVDFYFAERNTTPDITVAPNATINFQQWNLWRVWSSDGQRFYDIEHEEEYLHNYASNDSYGNPQDGMPWGLKGKQLSKEHDSFICNVTSDEWQEYIKDNPLKYDFYIGKHDDDNNDNDEFTKDGGTLHNYAGREFTKEIAENPNSEIKYLNLSESADSAVEYCYSKNKRNSDGSVDVKWYLPSTDEMEDIIVAGYSSFKEFQDNYYWTSQPAYIRNAFYYEYHEGSRSSAARDTYAFIAYEDNTEYARATKVVISDNDDYDYIRSGLNKTPANIPELDQYCKDNKATILGYFNITYAWYRYTTWSLFGGTQVRTSTDKWPKENERDTHFWEKINGDDQDARYHLHCGYLDELIQKTTVNGVEETGYRLRTESNRIRAVYRSGTKQ